MRGVLEALGRFARLRLGDAFVESKQAAALDVAGPDFALAEVLSPWAQSDSRPRVPLLDEIDSLAGGTPFPVLRPVRSCFRMRPRSFPQSIVLCDERDWHLRSGRKGEAVAAEAASTSGPGRCDRGRSAARNSRSS